MRLIHFGILIMLLIFQTGCAYSGIKPIAPFSTDGCSDFPDGSLKNPKLWRQCCVAHDLKYWAGGTVEERIQADEDLQQCVAAVGQPGTSGVMLVGVRFFGSPWLPTSYRWGYGWPFTHGYKALTPEEAGMVDAQRSLLKGK